LHNKNIAMESDSKVSEAMIQELRMVFDACDMDNQGLISLTELANLSKSHLGGAQLEELLQILNTSEPEPARIDFPQFCQQMINLMNNSREKTEDFADSYSEGNVRTVNVMVASPVQFCPEISSDQGAFNENLARSFQRTRSGAAITSSPNKQTRTRMKKKVSQTRLAGNIPLVNTSSEDEAEDSFDRKIASSLSVARPLELQQSELLKRGSSLRSAVMKRQTRSQPSSPLLTLTEGSRDNSPRGKSQRLGSKMYPESDSDSSPLTEFLSSSVKDLEMKVGRLTKSALQSQDMAEEDMTSSGVDSLKADLEEEMHNSVLLARRHGAERIESERKLHSDLLDSMERERDLERRNFQLRYDQMSEERDSLSCEVVGLREKLELVSLEKSMLEQQVEESLSRQEQAEEDEAEAEAARRDRELELVNTVRTLSQRVAGQDLLLAELKEDNIVLRKQVADLTASKEKRETGRFRMFGGNMKENCGSLTDRAQDPQDIRLKLKHAEQQLAEQVEANRKLNGYLGEVLANVMASNPQLLERC